MTAPGAAILDAEGLRLTPAEKALFRNADPWGFILFARNLDSPDQIRALCADMREAVGRDAPITVDQEGGRVQRLRPPLAQDWPAPLDHARRAGAHAAEVMRLRYRIIGAELRALGIDSNCAPLADVAGADTHPFLRDRCYGTDPGTVARLGRAVADGLLAQGVLPVLKHIPGHGRARQDSHKDLPVVTASREDLCARDFATFRALRDLPLAMTAHLVYPALDHRPATLSPVVLRMIRDDLGFDGLIMTDDISMRALQGRPDEIASDARAAGCDLVLLCNAPLAVRQEVAGAAGRLDARARTRAARALARRVAPGTVDIAALRARLDTLMTGSAHD